MKIIPAIDIIGGKTVRLEKGEYARKLSYKITPLKAAKKWEEAGAELIHVVDLDGAKEGRPVNLPVIEDIARSLNVPVQAGGGFRTEVDIKKALNAGVYRVIVGSGVLEDMDFAKKVIRSFRDRLMISVDIGAGGKARTRGWEKETTSDIYDVIGKLRSFGAKEIIFTSVQKDGTLSGPDTDLVKKVLASSGMNVIYAGGVSSMEDIRKMAKLERLGLTGVIIGRALYDGAIDLKEAIDELREENNSVS